LVEHPTHGFSIPNASKLKIHSDNLPSPSSISQSTFSWSFLLLISIAKLIAPRAHRIRNLHLRRQHPQIQ
jgi:hypothetical protein